MIGFIRNRQSKACVISGLGGIPADTLRDEPFRIAPLNKRGALEMMCEIKANKILGAVRAVEPVDRDFLSKMLITVGEIDLSNDAINETDIKRVIISDSRPTAVDAL